MNEQNLTPGGPGRPKGSKNDPVKKLLYKILEEEDVYIEPSNDPEKLGEAYRLTNLEIMLREAISIAKAGGRDGFAVTRWVTDRLEGKSKVTKEIIETPDDPYKDATEDELEAARRRLTGS